MTDRRLAGQRLIAVPETQAGCNPGRPQGAMHAPGQFIVLQEFSAAQRPRAPTGASVPIGGYMRVRERISEGRDT